MEAATDFPVGGQLTLTTTFGEARTRTPPRRTLRAAHCACAAGAAPRRQGSAPRLRRRRRRRHPAAAL